MNSTLNNRHSFDESEICKYYSLESLTEVFEKCKNFKIKARVITIDCGGAIRFVMRRFTENIYMFVKVEMIKKDLDKQQIYFRAVLANGSYLTISTPLATTLYPMSKSDLFLFDKDISKNVYNYCYNPYVVK